MTPRSAPPDKANTVLPEIQVSGDIDRSLALIVPIANHIDLIGRDTRFVVSLADAAATLLHSVANVFDVRAKKQMIGANAGRIVAAVKDMTISGIVEVDQVREAMSTCLTALKRQGAVAVAILASSPQPAGTRRINFFPELADGPLKGDVFHDQHLLICPQVYIKKGGYLKPLKGGDSGD